MAATAYASVVSLMQTIDHILEHGRNSFALNYEQIQSIQEKAVFLVGFLECYSHGNNEVVEALESQIADAAHAAEDLIETKVVDYIHDHRSRSFDRTRSNPFCLRLQDVIRAMDLMKNKAMEIKGKGELKLRLPKDPVPSNSSSSVIVDKDIMVGFDDVLIQIMDRLTRQQSNRLIYPISGMGGIGKTTLTRYLYENSFIVQHFDIRGWVTISQDYEMKEILSSLLIRFKVLSKQATQVMCENELGEKIYKHLFGRRYLIVMDDMWSIDVWNKIQRFFPDNGNGSGVVITTRLTNMASDLGSCGYEMNFLDEDQSWNLLRQKVFGQQECTFEFEEIGKRIAKNCKGLPLSIVVIAGILAKSNMTQEFWYHVAEKVNSTVSEAEDGHCSKILSLSYVNLPVHLKPCFLYMGVFPEDHEIDVSKLIRLWVSEGFLKPHRAKSLEEVAEDYLMDLIDRNLIMVHKQAVFEIEITCKIHDLLRELCIREAQKEKFFSIAKSFDSSQTLHNQRRIVVDKIETGQKDSTSLLRSITCSSDFDLSFIGGRLIRVLNGTSFGSLENIVNLVNLRYLNFGNYGGTLDSGSSIINLLWNIQSLYLRGMSVVEPLEIWDMKQLRHLFTESAYLTEPSSLMSTIDGGQEDSNVKCPLQTLIGIYDLTLSEGVVKRIPNIKKMQLFYKKWTDLDKEKDFCLGNLQDLHKLESLSIDFISYNNNLQRKILFPHSLKQLELYETHIPWEDMTIIGCLPNLQVLRLLPDAFIGEEWNPIEGQFISLKYLEIMEIFSNYLKVWNAESIHFPVLEHILLRELKYLKEIPLGIGEIPTLRCIQLHYCNDSVVSSAIDILDDQEIQGNDEIQVRACLRKNETQLQNLGERDNLELYIQN